MSRFIFSINSGRSGSDYLHHLLATARNVASFHEPYPDMAGRYVTRFPASDPTLLQRLLYPPMYARKYWQKVRGIRKTMRALPPGTIYAESNHMFILAFHDVVMRHFENVDVVLLRRYLPAVVRSFAELGHFGEKGDEATPFWMTSPNSPSAAVGALDDDDRLDQIDRIIGYLIDVEARAQRFMRQHPDTRVVEARLEELNETGRVRAFFAALDLEETPATLEMLGRPQNKKVEHKERVGNRVSLEYCRERVESYLDRCRQKGIELPALPQMVEIQRSTTAANP